MNEQQSTDEQSARYVVVGHTPGYLSEDDDPAEFDSYADAVAYMNEEAERYEDGDYGDTYRVEYGWASGQNYAAVMVWDDSKTHDLGYCIEVLQAEDDDEGEVLVGCPGCGGYIDAGRALCTNCALPPAVS